MDWEFNLLDFSDELLCEIIAWSGDVCYFPLRASCKRLGNIVHANKIQTGVFVKNSRLNKTEALKYNRLIAKAGYNKVLKWLYLDGTPETSPKCAHAAQQGYFEVVQYLIRKNVPYDNRITAQAALRGHLEILKWLYFWAGGNNFGLDECAARHGHLHILQWLYSIGVRIDINRCRLQLQYTSYQRGDVDKWLYNLQQQRIKSVPARYLLSSRHKLWISLILLIISCLILLMPLMVNALY
jgi:hypothetical protein